MTRAGHLSRIRLFIDPTPRDREEKDAGNQTHSLSC